MIQEVEFKSSDVILRGRYCKPEENNNKLPLVIIAVGDGKKGCKGWTPLMERYLSEGIATFAFDYHGLGISDGDSKDLSLSVGLENLKSGINYIKSFEWVDHERIGIFGSSFGGNLALLYTGLFDTIKVLALRSPVSFYPETHENEFTEAELKRWKEKGYNEENGFSYNFYLDAFDHNTYSVAKKIKVPCLIVHGDSDTIVPVNQSKRLCECLSGIKELHILEGVDHWYKENNALTTLTELAISWFHKYL